MVGTGDWPKPPVTRLRYRVWSLDRFGRHIQWRARHVAARLSPLLSAIPESPSQRLGRAISAELEHAILACLEKSRSKRPQTARDLAAMLDRVTQRWTVDDAKTWWSRHERGQQSGRSAGTNAVRDSALSETNSASATAAAPPNNRASAKAPQQAKTFAPGLDRTLDFEPPGDSTN